MRATPIAVAAMAAIIAMSATALAQPATQAWTPRPEAGVYTGYTMFAETSGLGNAHYKDDIAGDAMIFGLRFGYPVIKPLTIEADVGLAPVKFRAVGNAKAQQEPGGDATVITTLLQARWSFMPGQTIDPFVTLGTGMVFQTADKDFVQTFDNDTALTAGAGVQARITFRLRARLDLRWIGSNGPPEAQTNPQLDPPVADGDTPTFAGHTQVLLGVSYLIGGPDEDTDLDGLPNNIDKCPHQAEDKDGFQDGDGCPELDNDGDNIPDTKDKCPGEAEDFDKFQDEDGCPEADNDGDGLADASDKCPNKAEDKDGFQDGDGCPELDNDKDGVPDARDRCKNKPEDKDGFQDGDGCPDADNDHDRIPDAKDKCPNKPETLNGIEDTDGCPDKLPEHIAVLFDGPLQGVKFSKRNKLNRKAGTTLEKLLELMLENETVKIEIHVHADGKGKAGKLKAVSMQRAETIRKFYEDAGIDASRFVLFGHGNTQPIAEGKSRKAKAKNNRIELKVHRPE